MENNNVASVDSSVVASNEVVVKVSRPRGFAAMDKDKVRAISSMGGRAAWSKGTAHKFNSETAKVFGSKGGRAPHVNRGRVRVETPVEVDSSGETQV